jgi:hypothetical protein
MLTGCNGAGNGPPNGEVFYRPTALIDDGSVSGIFGNVIILPWQSGNDMVAFNAGDNHYYLARSNNNSPFNGGVDPVSGDVDGCPGGLVPGAINYGGAIYTSANVLGAPFGLPTFSGPQALGMLNATTLENDPDTITGLGNCPKGAPGPLGVGKTVIANAHGTNHSVGADPGHNQIYLPVASTAFATGMTGICAAGGGVDTNGCIAVFQTQGSDP